jgi:transcriptional regulator with XRE-family HTH domain
MEGGMTMFNHNKLRGKIREIYKTQDAFAAAMGLSATSLSLKLNNNVDFTQSEIAKAVELLGVDISEMPVYFFCSESSSI